MFTRKALDYLIKLVHTEIGFIGGIDRDYEGNVWPDERREVFEKYLTKQGLFIEDYVKIGGFNPKDGYQLMENLLEDKNKPSAVFVGSDTLAIGCYKACHELGLSIPEDISIIGFNDVSQARYMVPPLTTVRLYTDYMGEAVVELVEEKMRNSRELGKKVVIPTKIIVRESTSVKK